MAGFLPPAIFEIKAIADQAIAKFQDVNNELEKMDGQAAKAGGSIDKMQKVSGIATAALIGMGTAFAGFAAIGIKEAQETEQIFTKLGVTLSNLGISSAATRAQVEELSGSYVKLGFGGDEAASALNVLLNSTGDLAESQKLLAISADLARLKNIDLGTAASILGKASNGSTKAFKELGITLDESLPKSEALKKAMDELATQTGGQAIAFTKTFAGQLVVMKEQFKDSAESVGSFLLPKLNALLQLLNNGIAFVKRNAEAFKIFKPPH